MAITIPKKTEAEVSSMAAQAGVSKTSGLILPERQDRSTQKDSLGTAQTPPSDVGILEFIARGIADTFVQPIQFAAKTGTTIGSSLAKNLSDETAPFFKGIAERLKISKEQAESLQRVVNGETSSPFDPLNVGLQRIDTSAFASPEEAVGSFLETSLNLVAPTLGVGLGKDFIKTGIKTAFRRTALKGLVEGTTLGSGYGLAGALQQEKNVDETMKDILVGAGLGSAFGLAIPILGRGFTKMAGIPVKVAKLVSKPARSFFKKTGFDKLGAELFVSTKARLASLGEEGTEIINRFINADRNAQIRIGRTLDRFEQAGFAELDSIGAQRIFDAAEGRLFKGSLSPTEARIFEEFDSLRNNLGDEAVELGLEVRLRKGVSQPFQKRENYFPHISPAVSELKKENGKIRTQVLEATVRRGEFENIEEASRVLDSYLEFVDFEGRGGEYWINHLVESGQANNKTEAKGMALRFFKQSRLKKSGTLEKARELDFPFFDPDPRRVIPLYISSNLERLEVIKQFGQKGRVLDSLLGKLQENQGIEAVQTARRLVNTVQGTLEKNPTLDTVLAGFRTLQIPKLAFAQIVNLGQSLNTLLASDSTSFFKGLGLAFTKEGKRLALQAGTTTPTAIKTFVRKADANSHFGEIFLKNTGFLLSEKFLRRTAANAGAVYAKRLFKIIQTGKEKQAQRASLLLKDFGVDVSAALGRGDLNEDDILSSAHVFTEITQFKSRPMDLPAFATTPAGKVVFQFKSFAFQQGKFLKDQLKKDVKNKNYSGLVRDLMLVSTVFPLGGEVFADIKSLVTGSKRPTNALERYFGNLSSAGGLGIATDLFLSASNEWLLETLAGPAVGQAVDLFELGSQTLTGEKDVEDYIKFILKQSGVGNPLKNYLFPSKTKGRETILETLEKI